MSADRSRWCRRLLVASALGEMGVGAIGLVQPRILGILLDAELDRSGLVVARMLATAALAIGLTWWLARKAPDAVSRNAAGFLVYNLGVGTLFVLHGYAAPHPGVPVLVGLAHLGAGLGFLALARRP